MPIYNSTDYPSIIARLKGKLAAKGVVMGPTLSETEIAAFERACNTRLPEAYRLFLQQVGDGCGDTYQLITAGKWAGEVWNFCDVGAGPCCERQDFLGWLELWVDSDFDADFFKDYE